MAIEGLEKEYLVSSGRYAALCVELERQMNELLRRQEITLALPIEHRVKSWQSLSEKIERNKLSPSCLADVHDIAGLRIITLFRRDITTVSGIIEQAFDILDKRTL